MKDIIKIFRLRLLLIIRKPVLILMCILIPLLFYFFSFQIINNKSDSNRIPIAVVDEDRSEISEKVIEHINKNEFLKCSSTDRKTALRALEEEDVQGVYILKDNFEKNIEAGNMKNLVEVYYLKDNKLAPALTEIFSSEILPEVCSTAGANYIENIYSMRGLDAKGIKDNIIKDTDKQFSEGAFSMVIDLNIEGTGQADKSGYNPINALSTQWVLGLYIIFISIFLVFNCSSLIDERRRKLRIRIAASGINPISIFLGDLLAFIFIGSLLNIFQIMLISGMKNVNVSGIICILLIDLLYLFCLSNILIFFSYIFRNTVAFQSFITMFILFMGLIGGSFFNIDLMPQGIRSISVFTPTYWVQTATFNAVTGVPSSILGPIMLLALYGIVFMTANIIKTALSRMTAK